MERYCVSCKKSFNLLKDYRNHKCHNLEKERKEQILIELNLIMSSLSMLEVMFKIPSINDVKMSETLSMIISDLSLEFNKESK